MDAPSNKGNLLETMEKIRTKIRKLRSLNLPEWVVLEIPNGTYGGVRGRGNYLISPPTRFHHFSLVKFGKIDMIEVCYYSQLIFSRKCIESKLSLNEDCVCEANGRATNMILVSCGQSE